MPSPTPSTPSFAVSTLFRRLAQVVLGIYLLYLIPMNAALVSGLISGAVSEGVDKSFNFKHGLAWSPLPGLVYLRDVEINGTDPNVFWQIKIDRMRFRARLSKLLHKKLLITQLRATGAHFAVSEHTPEKRAKVRELRKADEEKRAGELLAEGKTEKKSPLQLRIEDIRLEHFTTAQMNTVQYSGDGTVTGTFELHPGQFLEVIGGEWAINSGNIRSGDTDVLSGLQGRTRVTIHPTDLENAKGNEIFRTFDIDQKITSNIFDAEIFRSLIQGYRPMIFGRTEGDLAINLQVTSGFIRAGTSIHGRLDKLTLRLAGAELDGRGNLDWTVAPTAQGKSPVGSLALNLDPVAWKGQKTKTGALTLLARSNHFALTGETRELSLVEPFRDLVLRLQVGRAETGRLETVIQHLAGGKVQPHPILSGEPATFDLDATIKPTPGTFAGRFRVETPALALTTDAGATVLNSHVRGQIELSSNDYEAGRFVLKGAQLGLSDLRIVHGGKETYAAKDWGAKLQVNGAKLETKGDFAFDGKAVLQLTNVGAPAKMAAPDAGWLPVVLFLYPMNHLEIQSDVHLRSDGYFLPNVHAKSSSGTIDGHYIADNGTADLGLFFDVSPANVCLTKGPRDEKISFGLFKSREKCLPNEKPSPVLARPDPVTKPSTDLPANPPKTTAAAE